MNVFDTDTSKLSKVERANACNSVSERDEKGLGVVIKVLVWHKDAIS